MDASGPTAVHYDAGQVVGILGAHKTKVDTFLTDNIPALLDNLKDAAVALHASKQTDKVAAVRDAFRELQTLQGEAAAFSAALSRLEGTYEASGGETDFGAQLDSFAQEHVQNFEMRAEQDEQLRDLDRELGGAGPAAELDEDEDVQVEGDSQQLAPNQHCPLTGKQVLNLDDPVEDQRGIVYERAAIVDYIKRKHGSAQCPMAATNHHIRERDLRKAKKVLRAQKAARERPAAAEGEDEADGSGAGKDDDIVLDVD